MKFRLRRVRVVFAVLLLLLSIAAPTLAQDSFVFGVVLVGPKNDHGWSQAHYEAGLRIESTITGSKMLLFESLNPADNPQTSLLDVATQMAEQGAKLIFTTSDEFEEDTVSVAKQLPEVTFISITGSTVLEGKAPPNVGNFNGIGEMAEEIAGCAAALTTKTNSIGYVGPLINFETRRLAASVFLGARYCFENYRKLDPTAMKFTISWIGFWFNIPGVTLDPTAEAQTLYDNGADIVFSAIDTTEATVVGQKLHSEGQDVFSVGYDSQHACVDGPDVCIGAPYYNWYPAYLSTALAVQNGSWKQSWDWIPPTYGDINHPDTSIVGFVKGPAMTKEVSDTLDLFIAEQAAYSLANPDSLFLWEGPLNFQDGEVLAKEGETVVPVQSLETGLSVWYLPQLLEGMTGASNTK